jgi:hypothetical protein
MQERKGILSKISRIFRKKKSVQLEVPSVTPAEQPVVQTKITTPEWQRREQQRLSWKAVKRSQEEHGIGIPAGGTVYINPDQTAQNQPIPNKSSEPGILPEIRTVDKTPPSTAKKPRKGWG